MVEILFCFGLKLISSPTAQSQFINVVSSHLMECESMLFVTNNIIS